MSNNKSNDKGFASILRLLFWAPIIIVFICTGKCVGPTTACNEIKQMVNGEAGSDNETSTSPVLTTTPDQLTIPRTSGYKINVPDNVSYTFPQGQESRGIFTRGTNFSNVNTYKPNYQHGGVPQNKGSYNPVGNSVKTSYSLPLQTTPTTPAMSINFQPIDKPAPAMKLFRPDESEKLGLEK